MKTQLLVRTADGSNFVRIKWESISEPKLGGRRRWKSFDQHSRSGLLLLGVLQKYCFPGKWRPYCSRIRCMEGKWNVPVCTATYTTGPEFARTEENAADAASGKTNSIGQRDRGNLVNGLDCIDVYCHPEPDGRLSRLYNIYIFYLVTYQNSFNSC